jgi:ABC-2 type transport system permease protein
MTTWETLALVIRRELIERGKTKAFLFSSLFTILLLIGSIALPVFLGQRAQTYEVGVLGAGHEAIVEAAVALGNADEDEGGVTINTTEFSTIAALEDALDEGTVEIGLVDGAELVTPSGTGAASSSLEGLLQDAAAAVRLDELSGEAAQAAQILSDDALELRSLGELASEDTEARVIVALGGLVLMYMAILSYGSWTLAGVTEEKANRVVEVLLATVKPWQLLAGKIVGIGLLGLGQFVMTIVVAVLAIRVTDAIDLPAIPVSSLPMLVLWFVLGYALYAVGFGAAGALVSRMEDAQSVATPFTVMSIIGFFISFQVLDNPSGLLARVTSLFPPTAPFAAPVRAAFGAMPWWEMTLAVVIMLITIVVLVRFAGRAYSGGLLRFGSKVSWKEAIRSAEL